MASRNATVAESVKTQLNAAAATDTAFGVTFEAKRTYAPTENLEDTKAWTVDVWTPGDQRSQPTRGRAGYEIPVLICIQKRLPLSCDPAKESGNTVIDPMVEVAEKVQDFFGPAFTAGGAVWSNVSMALASADWMREQRQFSAVITVTLFQHL